MSGSNGLIFGISETQMLYPGDIGQKEKIIASM